MPSISWSDIDINKNSKGYLDSLEVVNARKRGIENVFVGMIQADFEGTIDIDEIIEKYKRPADGRMPIFGNIENRNRIIDLYRELVVLKCKYQNVEIEYNQKFGLWDDAKNLLAKISIIKENEEYKAYKKQIEELKYEVYEKEQELIRQIDSTIYERTTTNTGDVQTITMHYHALY